MVVGLTGEENGKLINLLARKDFASNSTRLKLILYNADLQDVTNRLDFDQAPYELIFNIIYSLSQMGADESNREALGRFLNTIIDGNFVTDQQEKQFINSLIKKYDMMPSITASSGITVPTTNSRTNREEQVNLRESCSKILTLYENSNMSKKEDDDKFWKYFNEFYTHVDNVKTRYNIEKLFEKLQNIKVDTETQKQIEEQAKIINLKTGELAAHKSILLNYLNIIEIVIEINEKALEIEEGKKTQNIDFRWANRFFNNYYTIIENIGAVDQILKWADNEIDDVDKIKRHLSDQQRNLWFVGQNINILKKLQNDFPNYPEDISKGVTVLDTNINNILKILDTQEDDIKAKIRRASYEHKEKEIRKTIKDLYEDTLKKCFPE